jgi:hypothetical protein
MLLVRVRNGSRRMTSFGSFSLALTSGQSAC